MHPQTNHCGQGDLESSLALIPASGPGTPAPELETEQEGDGSPRGLRKQECKLSRMVTHTHSEVRKPAVRHRLRARSKQMSAPGKDDGSTTRETPDWKQQVTCGHGNEPMCPYLVPLCNSYRKSSKSSYWLTQAGPTWSNELLTWQLRVTWTLPSHPDTEPRLCISTHSEPSCYRHHQRVFQALPCLPPDSE